MFTEIERRTLASQAVKIARNTPIRERTIRAMWLQTARENYTQANNIAYRARFAGGK